MPYTFTSQHWLAAAATTALLVGCTQNNPAFRPTSASDGGSGSDSSGQTSDPTTSDATTVDVPTTSSGGETEATTMGTTEPTTVDPTTGEPTTDASESDPTDTGETTEDPCDVCFGEDAFCEDIYTLGNCIDACASYEMCEADELCWTFDGISKCDMFEADCIAHAENYQGFVGSNRECMTADDCTTVEGHCQVPGGKCFEVVNKDADPTIIAGTIEGWQAAGCDKEPGVGCTVCDGQQPPDVDCIENLCTAI